MRDKIAGRGGCLRHRRLRADGISEDYERLSGRGVEFASPPEERFYLTEAIVKVDSGNRFSLTRRKR